ncbi:hypothetical protein AB0395_09935 [Streptosporangium sp. NPDC051023]|uniref:hypothetical protein n=1 Tax=Streptosporangium sp. NPDC051023 TaxID=3155410 RepID=UPI0034503596
MDTGTTDTDGVLDRGPVGRWRTAGGTATVLACDEVVFAPDGTGLLHTHSVVFGPETLEFRWRMPGRACLWIRLTDTDKNDDLTDTDEAGDGELISLEFRSHETDTGRQTVLAETGQNGFWLLLDPLERIGDT